MPWGFRREEGHLQDIKSRCSALAGVAHLVGTLSYKLKDHGLIPGQVAPRCGFGPQLGCVGEAAD